MLFTQDNLMKSIQKILVLSFFVMSVSFWAADAIAAGTAAISPSGGMLKMVLGLAIVLAVMALITWVLKRMMPGVGSKQSVVRIVGGVSVGSRERVVVLEIAGRWIVVGVAPGQVNHIANLEINAAQLAESALNENNTFNQSNFKQSTFNQGTGGFTETFTQWLNKSTGKILDKKDVSQ